MLMHPSQRRLAVFSTVLAVFVVAPSLFLMLVARQGAYDTSLTILTHLLSLLLPLSLLVWLSSRNRVALHALAGGMALYGLVTYFLIAYWLYTGGPFDVYWAWDSLRDVLPTVQRVIGIGGMAGVSSLMLLLTCTFFYISSQTLQQCQALYTRVPRCHIFAQPYGGGMLAILRGNEKVIYDAEERTVTRYDLQADFYEQSPVTLARDVSHEAFMDHYVCARYRHGEGGIRGSSGKGPYVLAMGRNMTTLSLIPSTPSHQHTREQGYLASPKKQKEVQ